MSDIVGKYDHIVLGPPGPRHHMRVYGDHRRPETLRIIDAKGVTLPDKVTMHPKKVKYLGTTHTVYVFSGAGQWFDNAGMPVSSKEAAFGGGEESSED